jgi:SAM-dependent MidA family methyltransferase
MSRNILPEPPGELKQLSETLCARIRDEMDEDGMMSFSRFMEMTLYEPGLGYYSAGLHKLGESGDFITAPELGPLFAGCLAGQLSELAAGLGKYDILEAGAGTGALAADLLRALLPGRLPDRYLILERSADLREIQRQVISEGAPGQADRVEWLDRPPEFDWKGVLIANEVLDALAVERFRIGENGVEQVCVEPRNGGFGWAFRQASDRLGREVSHVLSDVGIKLPPGYRSEINLHTRDWLQAISGRMTHGLALFIDYGYPRREFYLPERSDGTLMCHYRHRAHNDPFFWPGLQDITAWVDFTSLAEAADHCGLDVEGYCSQSFFLLGCGLESVLGSLGESSEDGGLALGAQARQLTLPGMMGEKFQVMGLGRGLEDPLRGFSLQDLRHRL